MQFYFNNSKFSFKIFGKNVELASTLEVTYFGKFTPSRAVPCPASASFCKPQINKRHLPIVAERIAPQWQHIR